MYANYTTWELHGEIVNHYNGGHISEISDIEGIGHNDSEVNMLEDAFGVPSMHLGRDEVDSNNNNEEPKGEAAKFYRLLNEYQEPLTVGTLLNIKGKTKDTIKARIDLMKMGIRNDLHPILEGDKVRVPVASYTLNSNAKAAICDMFASIKSPDGYMSNLSRYLRTLKKYIRNRAQPEGCIAEGYLADECLTFCSRYMSDIDSKFNRKGRNDDVVEYQEDDLNFNLDIFKPLGHPFGQGVPLHLDFEECNQIHLYNLLNCDDLLDFVKEHKLELEKENARNVERRHKRQFAGWIYDRDGKIDEKIYNLVCSPSRVVRRYAGYVVNGFRFHTIDRCENRKTHNCGVMVRGDDYSDKEYYGVLKDIFEMSYPGGNRIFVYKCAWFDVQHLGRGYKVDDHGFVSVNKRGSLKTDEVYVLESQVEQVFYIQDPKTDDWQFVIKTQPRDLYDMPSKDIVDQAEINDQVVDVEAYQQVEVDEAKVSERNSRNRLSKNRTTQTTGNLSFAEVEDILTQENNGVKPPADVIWLIEHTKENDEGVLEWADESRSKEIHEQLKVVVAAHGESKTQEEILLDVLKPRSGYFRGKGTALPGFSKGRHQLEHQSLIREQQKKIQEQQELIKELQENQERTTKQLEETQEATARQLQQQKEETQRAMNAMKEELLRALGNRVAS
uniref:DUF4216 domain-containing protein n=1 Tax=Chenopodium quinoa TaxID=63459 RepID=A0A803NDN4_CHEQI